MTTDLISPSTSGAVAARLAEREPFDNTQRLRSLLRPLQPSDANVVPLSMMTTGVSPSERLLRAAEQALTPPTEGMLRAWLAELSILLPMRAGEAGEQDLRLRAYSDRLRPYPADIVRAALLDRVWSFWPSWAELHPVLETCMATRRSAVAEVRAAALPPAAEVVPVRDEPAKDRAARRATAAEIMAGFARGRRVAPQGPHAPVQEAGEAPSRLAHWTQTALSDDPRWAVLREARLARAAADVGRRAEGLRPMPELTTNHDRIDQGDVL